MIDQMKRLDSNDYFAFTIACRDPKINKIYPVAFCITSVDDKNAFEFAFASIREKMVQLKMPPVPTHLLTSGPNKCMKKAMKRNFSGFTHFTCLKYFKQYIKNVFDDKNERKR